MKFNILIIDDEKLVCSSIKRIIEDKYKVVYSLNKPDAAYDLIETKNIDLILLDYKLGETDGLTVLKKFHEKYPDIMVIMLTAFATVGLAIDAMKSGAYDFIQKGEDASFIRYTIERALDRIRLKKEVEELRQKVLTEPDTVPIIAESKNTQNSFAIAKEFAKTDVTVLLTGETGSGKSMIAKFIHNNSPRFNRHFISINCAAIPTDLLESELFGYEKGAFTGARDSGKKGIVEQANGGTLLLDEIGELNIKMQTKLLHLLEEGEVYSVGGIKPIKVDVRFIAATNSNITELVEEKKIRSDLYYRLNVAHLEIPPLRKRCDDIIPLTKMYINKFNETFRKSITTIDDNVKTYLCSLKWKGNIRELRNYIERAVLLSKGTTLTLEGIFNSNYSKTSERIYPSDFTFNIQLDLNPDSNLLHQAQQQMIEQALELTGQNRTQAAKMLGIPRTSLNYYIKRYNIL